MGNNIVISKTNTLNRAEMLEDNILNIQIELKV